MTADFFFLFVGRPTHSTETKVPSIEQRRCLDPQPALPPLSSSLLLLESHLLAPSRRCQIHPERSFRRKAAAQSKAEHRRRKSLRRIAAPQGSLLPRSWTSREGDSSIGAGGGSNVAAEEVAVGSERVCSACSGADDDDRI